MGFTKNPCDVHGHITDTDHSNTLLVQVKFTTDKIRVAVVPGDKFCCRMTSRQLFPGDPQVTIERRTAGEHDLVIMP